jgi:hypothetical protein
VFDIDAVRNANLRVPDGDYTSEDFISQTAFNELHSIGPTSHAIDVMREVASTECQSRGGHPIQRMINHTQGLLLDNQCWLCEKHIRADGYLHLKESSPSRKNKFGHRIAFAGYYKFLPLRGIQIRHRCDNRNCFNPLHLHLGTCKDNVRDIIYRTGNMRGTNRYADVESVIAVKKLLIAGVKVKDIVCQTGMTLRQVRDIKYGVSYTYVVVTQDKVTITPPSFTET